MRAELAVELARLDVAVSTRLARSEYYSDAGPDTSGTTTLLGRLTATRAGYLDRLVNVMLMTKRELRVVIRGIILAFSDKSGIA